MKTNDDFEPAVPEYRAKAEQPAYKAGTRQAEPIPVITGERPWWAKAKPGQMEAAAKGEQARMSSSRESKFLGSTRFSFTW